MSNVPTYEFGVIAKLLSPTALALQKHWPRQSHLLASSPDTQHPGYMHSHPSPSCTPDDVEQPPLINCPDLSFESLTTPMGDVMVAILIVSQFCQQIVESIQSLVSGISHYYNLCSHDNFPVTHRNNFIMIKYTHRHQSLPVHLIFV